MALTYLGFGLTVAIVSGWIDRPPASRTTGWRNGFATSAPDAVDLPPENLTAVDRIKAGIEAVNEIVGNVWPWIIAGIAAGAFIHGYVPSDLAGHDHGAGRLVVGAGCGPDRHSHVFERRGHYPGG